MALKGWLEKATNLLSSAWRTQGVPESDEVATQDFLQQLSDEFAARIDGNNMRAAYELQPVESITVDEEGFDCRIGERARKRRREANKVVDPKQKLSDAKSGGALLPMICFTFIKAMPH